MKKFKIQSHAALKKEMKAVARGEKPAPEDAGTPSFNCVGALRLLTRGRRFGIGAKAPEGVRAMSKKHMGSSLDDFLKEEGLFEEAQAVRRQEALTALRAEVDKGRKSGKPRPAGEVLDRLEKKYAKQAQERG